MHYIRCLLVLSYYTRTLNESFCTFGINNSSFFFQVHKAMLHFERLQEHFEHRSYTLGANVKVKENTEVTVYN